MMHGDGDAERGWAGKLRGWREGRGVTEGGRIEGGGRGGGDCCAALCTAVLRQS
jgi:hypothetical protein